MADTASSDQDAMCSRSLNPSKMVSVFPVSRSVPASFSARSKEDTHLLTGDLLVRTERTIAEAFDQPMLHCRSDCGRDTTVCLHVLEARMVTLILQSERTDEHRRELRSRDRLVRAKTRIT